MKIHSALAKLRQITPNYHESLLDSLVNMQLASRNPFSGQTVADEFFSKLTGPPPSKCTLTFARSFAELLRRYPYPQTPAISRRCIKGKAITRGLGVWFWQSLTFGSLAAACGFCFLRLQKAMLSSAGKDVRLWRSRVQPTNGKVNVRSAAPFSATLLLRSPGWQGVGAIYKLHMYTSSTAQGGGGSFKDRML